MLDDSQHIVKFSDVSKIYGNLKANDQLNFAVVQGSIHALIGENGAGKSTAMKMLYGMERPTTGKIWIRGKAVSFTSSKDALKDGIGMVHQHFMLSPVHSALENVMLGVDDSAIEAKGWWPKCLRPFDTKKLEFDLTKIATKMGFNIPWHTPVEELSVGVQQQIEIIKLLHSRVEIMIFDEPTAVLSPEEIDKFIEMLKNLKEQGKTSIIITHKLAEVKSVADNVTIMRAGKTVQSGVVSEFSVPELASLMVGRQVDMSSRGLEAPTLGAQILSLESISFRKGDRPY